MSTGGRRVGDGGITNLCVDEGVSRITGDGGDGYRRGGTRNALAIGGCGTKQREVEANRPEGLDDQAPSHARISAFAATVTSTARMPIQPSTLNRCGT